jgi:hypothetical protein
MTESLQISLRNGYLSKISKFYKVWPKAFKIEKSESQDDFSNFMNLRILLGEGYLSKIPNFIKFDQKIFRIDESELQHGFFALKMFDQTL